MSNRLIINDPPQWKMDEADLIRLLTRSLVLEAACTPEMTKQRARCRSVIQDVEAELFRREHHQEVLSPTELQEMLEKTFEKMPESAQK